MRRDLRHPVGPGSVYGRTLMAALIIATLVAGASVAQAMEVSVSGNTMILSVPVVGDELPKVTDTRRVSSPDQATLPHRLRAQSMPASGYATIDDLGKVPLDSTEGLHNYRRFLDAGFPRAFAVAATRRHWAWNTGANDVSEALRRCTERAGQACTPYAVDETVVYKP